MAPKKILRFLFQVYEKTFVSWSEYLNKKPNRIPVPLNLFTIDQREGMASIGNDGFFPKIDYNQKMRGQLTCDFIFYARNIWNSFQTQLTSNDITDILISTDMIRLTANNDREQKRNQQPALVILPKTLNPKYSNLNNLQIASYLHLTCMHRDHIKLHSNDDQQIIKMCNPHLLSIHANDGFLLTKENKIHFNGLYIAFLTCLDLSLSTVRMQNNMHLP